MKHIAVIGAGAAGLAVLRHFAAAPNLFSVTAFEQANEIGGTWVYTEKVGKDDHGLPIHSSMYRNLITNLPHEVMQFPDFPFNGVENSFVNHQQVLQYLKDYATNFNLRRLIKFNTVVESVCPLDEKHRLTGWSLRYRDLNSNEQSTEEFSAIVVCNGHYSVPRIPQIDGMEHFKGEISHSHHYRKPEPFKDKTVVILGAHASGVDIAVDISPFAKDILLSHNQSLIKAKLPSKVRQVPGVESFTNEGAIKFFGREETHSADAFILCTGYHYDFPFLSSECKLPIDEKVNRLPTLWKHLIHCDFPTLSLIGICYKIAPFPHFDRQAQFVLKLFEDESKLPSKSEMLHEIEADYKWRLNELKMPKHHPHEMHNLQWDYMASLGTVLHGTSSFLNGPLADYGGFGKLADYVNELYHHVWRERQQDLVSYRNENYAIVDGQFRVIGRVERYQSCE